jgi:hypothetical protein
MAGKPQDITWNFDLTPIVGKEVIAETKEGHIRRFTLHGVEFHQLKVLQHVVDLPVQLVGDDDEHFPLTQLVSLKRA